MSTPSEMRVRLRPGREKALRQGHPWLFSGAIAAEEGPPEAALARVVTAGGEELGIGFYSARSQIRVRLLGRGIERVDRELFAARLAAAARLRAVVLPPETTGYRVLNAEGDGLPGWTVDRYADLLVSQITVAGLEALRGEAYAALAATYPECSILHLGGVPARREEGLAEGDETIRGPIPETVEFRESGLAFAIEPGAGPQKTGFYCDQRENRRLVERLAKGRRVLDLFAHLGAAGLYALRGGAQHVLHVESSSRLIERGRVLPQANDLPGDRVEWRRADVFELLRQPGEEHDLVVCDPPPLARRQSDVEGAARAYKDLNRLALRRVAAGGFFLTFSCSGAIDTKLFRQVLFAAAVEAGVEAQLLMPLCAAPDHPVAITHPQGEYLKGWLVAVGGVRP